VRFTLTAGQKGDAPQAAALLEGLPAESSWPNTAYDADHLRQVIAAKGALAVIPTTRHGRSNIRSTSISMPAPSRGVLLLKTSNNSAASQPVSKRQPELPCRRHSRAIILWMRKCPHHLARRPDL